MTMVAATGVLHRMTQRQQPDAPDVPLTASRAVRLAVSRGADLSAGLNVTVGSVGEQALPLDSMLEELRDDWLMIALARNGETIGVIACDSGFVSAAIEVMTTGKVATASPETRAITRTEGILVQPLLRKILDELCDTAARTALDGWTDDVALNKRFENRRAAGFALDDKTYRLIRLTLDCGGPERQGELMLALPLQPSALPAAQHPQPRKAVPNWHDSFRAAVMAAPARLDAVLHRMQVPLGTLTGLEVGQVLPLNGCTVGMVRLVSPDGRTVARGRLGQIAGRIAVRIQPADTIEMTEMGGQDAAHDGLKTNLPRGRIRAGGRQAMQIEDAPAYAMEGDNP